MLKAKYYPNGRLEDTVFSGNASSSWQAISYGLELLKKGLVWRVGNGQSIRIWRDSWIQRPFSYKLVSPKRRCRLRYVSELIDNFGNWKLDVLHQYFLQMDITEILKLRPSVRLEDCLAWAPDKRVVSLLRVLIDYPWLNAGVRQLLHVARFPMEIGVSGIIFGRAVCHPLLNLLLGGCVMILYPLGETST